MIRSSAALLLAACAFCTPAAFAADPVTPASTLEAMRVFDRVSPALALSGDEHTAIRDLLARNPTALQAAAAKMRTTVDLSGLAVNPNPYALTEVRRDLVDRAGLLAMAEGHLMAPSSLKKDRNALIADASRIIVPQEVPTDDKAFAFKSAMKTTYIVNPLHDEETKGPSGRSGVPSANNHYVSGDSVNQQYFGAVVRILRDDEMFCTGSLIDSTTVLTAAHCVVESGELISESRLKVKDSTSNERAARSLWAPPNYLHKPCKWGLNCPDLDLDVGVIFLKDAATTGVGPMASLAPPPNGRGPITLAGFGAADVLVDPASRFPLVGRQVIDMGVGLSRLAWSFNRDRENESSFCQGDSGGPVFLGSPRGPPAPLQIVGVISRVSRLGGSDPLYVEAQGCLDAEFVAINIAHDKVRTPLCLAVGRHPTLCASNIQ